jgi:flavin reductase (DIM6/NTAB) family NADH-FMN oxidoreductase RutF/rubredoxin
MIDINALFKVSYGLYLVSSGDKDKGNGFISNTFFQVTSDPQRFASCCSKDNYTVEFMQKHGAFAASVLHTETASEIFGKFGYKSGRDTEKMEGMNIKYGETGVPIVLDDAIAYLECRIVQTIDLGTHWLFIGDLVQSEVLNDELTPITYLDYRDKRKGLAPKNAPTYVDKSKYAAKKTSGYAKYKCASCGYIYDDETEEIKFADLPDNWTCPLCGSEKEDFFKL